MNTPRQSTTQVQSPVSSPTRPPYPVDGTLPHREQKRAVGRNTVPQLEHGTPPSLPATGALPAVGLVDAALGAYAG